MAEDDDIPVSGAAEEADKRRVGPRRSEASTNAVLVAAYTELSEHGWRGFSVDRVAKTAKASKQTIYRWWKSAACLAVDAALTSASIDGKRRGETLGVAEFDQLATALERARG